MSTDRDALVLAMRDEWHGRTNHGGSKRGLAESAADAILAAGFRLPRDVTDAEVEAAQDAYHEFAFGPEEPLTRRDKGITRQAWRVALQAARGVIQ